jgi:hypothetical protein
MLRRRLGRGKRGLADHRRENDIGALDRFRQRIAGPDAKRRGTLAQRPPGLALVEEDVVGRDPLDAGGAQGLGNIRSGLAEADEREGWGHGSPLG